jgi:hypothetical protein
MEPQPVSPREAINARTEKKRNFVEFMASSLLDSEPIFDSRGRICLKKKSICLSFTGGISKNENSLQKT